MVVTNDFVSQAEAARLLGVTTVTIWRWLKESDPKLRPVAFVDGNVPLFDRREVEQLAEMRRKAVA